MTKFAAVLFAASAAFAAPALAQDKSDWDKIVLEDKAGNVMTSVGGEYQTAAIGQQLLVGQHMMLSGDTTKAKVVYYELDDDGDVVNRCVKDYTDANTYIIDASSPPAAAWAGGTNAGMNAGIIVGAGVIGAALLNSEDNADVGPLSTGVRHL